MPFQPTESLLNLKMEKMHTIDTRSVEDLHGLWLVFHKASKMLEDGPRLENMSWRLWNRETFCCSPSSGAGCSRSTISRKKSPQRVPDLARSIDTISSDEFSVTDAADDSLETRVVRPELTRLDSITADGRTQKHISSVDFEKIVVSIQQTREIEPIDDLQIPALSTAADQKPRPIEEMAPPPAEKPQVSPSTELEAFPELDTNELQSSALTAGSSALTVTTSNATDASQEETTGSDTSSTAMSTHNIVRGFVPGGAPSSYRSQTTLAQPTPILKKSSSSNRSMAPPSTRRKAAEFTLGGSSAEEESSLESHTYRASVSSLAERLHRKQASFRDDNLVSKIQDSPVFESDDEDEEDEVSEGAIEDDDEDEEDSSDEWEDELGDDDGSDTEEGPNFQRVDSRPNLTSHRSLLTSLMHQGDRAAALQNAASRSVPALRRAQTTPPRDDSRAASPGPRERNGPDGQGSSALPIAISTSKQHAHLALSPRSTRRNMLQSELTESLRKHLLWERQHKNTTASALKRRHTSHDIKNLKQLPEVPHMSTKESGAEFSNDFFHAGLGEYHSKGW